MPFGGKDDEDPSRQRNAVVAYIASLKPTIFSWSSSQSL